MDTAMTYRGHVENGKVVLADEVALPEGTEVEVAVTRSPSTCARDEGASTRIDPSRPTIEEQIAAIWADVPASELDKLPPDLSDTLDHYIYGTPKE